MDKTATVVDLSRCALTICRAWLPITVHGERVIFGFAFECSRCGAPILAEHADINVKRSSPGPDPSNRP